MNNFELGKEIGRLEERISMIGRRIGCGCSSPMIASSVALWGARVHNQTDGNVRCWTGEPKPSTNNQSLFYVRPGETSPQDVDCDHVEDPSGQWWKCGEDLLSVRVVYVEPSGAVRNAECKTESYNKPCQSFNNWVDDSVIVTSARVDRAKTLYNEGNGNSYEKGCSGFICDVLQIEWENANSLMGNDPKYVGKDNVYEGLTAGDIVGWKVSGGNGHVALFVGEPGMKFLDVREENVKPRKVVNGYGGSALFKSNR